MTVVTVLGWAISLVNELVTFDWDDYMGSMSTFYVQRRVADLTKKSRKIFHVISQFAGHFEKKSVVLTSMVHHVPVHFRKNWIQHSIGLEELIKSIYQLFIFHKKFRFSKNALKIGAVSFCKTRVGRSRVWIRSASYFYTPFFKICFWSALWARSNVVFSFSGSGREHSEPSRTIQVTLFQNAREIAKSHGMFF